MHDATDNIEEHVRESNDKDKNNFKKLVSPTFAPVLVPFEP
jgi:hypothetical protein